jgi:hypothetical protein
MSSYLEKMLAQVQLVNAVATVIYQPARRFIVLVDRIVVCNYGHQASDLSLYHDNDGTTADNTTILMNAVPFGANLYRVIPVGIYMDNTEGLGGSLIALAADADYFNITVYGREVK